MCFSIVIAFWYCHCSVSTYRFGALVFLKFSWQQRSAVELRRTENPTSLRSVHVRQPLSHSEIVVDKSLDNNHCCKWL